MKSHRQTSSAVSLRGVLYFTLLLVVVATASCHTQKPSRSAKQEQNLPVQPPPSAPSQPPVEIPAPVPPAYESGLTYQQAKKLADSDTQKAIAMLEASIRTAPDDPKSASYYLLLGRINKEYETTPANYAGSPEKTEKQIKIFHAYAQAHPDLYFHDEPSGEYLYNGFHFKKLQKRFPTSPLAVEAAYEITKISQGGECESDIICPIDARFAPVRNFLTSYPDSVHTIEAVKRADAAFRESLWGPTWKTYQAEITDTTKPTNDYDPLQLKKLVGEYESLAEKLPPQFRPRIYETVAYYHARLRETDRARDLYNLILQKYPDYENVADVRRSLNDLQ